MLPLPVGTCLPQSSPLASWLGSPVCGQRHLEGFNQLSLKVLRPGVCGELGLDPPGYGSLSRACVYVGRQMSVHQTWGGGHIRTDGA